LYRRVGRRATENSPARPWRYPLGLIGPAAGNAAKDRSSVGLVFAKEPPRYEARTVPVLNPFFLIPAGADNFKVKSRHTFRSRARGGPAWAGGSD
jgi:hypothetical protein